MWLDRQGNETRLDNTRRRFSWRGRPALSPDGRRIAATIVTGYYDSDVQIYDTESADWAPLTAAGSIDGAVLWSPAGDWILFEPAQPPVPKIGRIRADRTGDVDVLTSGAAFDWASSLSSDGSVLAFMRSVAPGDWDIMTMSVDGDRTPRPFHPSPANEAWPAFSPDDRYIAYESHEGGGPAIYVAPYPGPGASIRVATGGVHPMWNPDGSELLYVADRTMWAVPIETGPEFRTTGPAQALFEKDYLPGRWLTRFTVSGDGQRFLMVTLLPARQSPRQLVYVSNWLGELAR